MKVYVWVAITPKENRINTVSFTDLQRSKTTICLMHLNYQFLFDKVLPNSVLSIKKSHACALEYGHNISIFANLSLVIHIRVIFAR